jgi:hypothetical protein
MIIIRVLSGGGSNRRWVALVRLHHMQRVVNNMAVYMPFQAGVRAQTPCQSMLKSPARRPLPWTAVTRHP